MGGGLQGQATHLSCASAGLLLYLSSASKEKDPSHLARLKPLDPYHARRERRAIRDYRLMYFLIVTDSHAFPQLIPSPKRNHDGAHPASISPPGVNQPIRRQSAHPASISPPGAAQHLLVLLDVGSCR
jgi:hypothetical protein